ncbi:MAG: hypothetical protein NTX60_02190 [Actinobacteria bacterium]|nr:hypothetical protein [Actinomycetota bacterium]
MASFIGVALGITGKRITWPWWALSSVLYGVLFFQWELYASAAAWRIEEQPSRKCCNCNYLGNPSSSTAT